MSVYYVFCLGMALILGLVVDIENDRMSLEECALVNLLRWNEFDSLADTWRKKEVMSILAINGETPRHYLQNTGYSS